MVMRCGNLDSFFPQALIDEQTKARKPTMVRGLLHAFENN
jgi:hypothetical protein